MKKDVYREPQAPGPPPTLLDVEPQSFAGAVIESILWQYETLNSALTSRPAGLSAEELRNTAVYADAMHLGRYAQRGDLPENQDEEDILRIFSDVARLLFSSPGRGARFDRYDIFLPFKAMDGSFDSAHERARLVDMVLVGALLRVELAPRRYEGYDHLLDSDQCVTVAELGLVAGCTWREVIAAKDAGDLRTISSVRKSDVPWFCHELVAHHEARRWLRAHRVAGF